MDDGDVFFASFIGTRINNNYGGMEFILYVQTWKPSSIAGVWISETKTTEAESSFDFGTGSSCLRIQ